MTIGFDFRMGGSINSGIGRYAFELLKALLEADTNGQYVIFYNQNNVDVEDLKILQSFPNTQLVATSVRHYSLAEQLWLPRILKKYKCDLVHFPNFNVPVFYSKPFVVTIHDVVHHKISGHKKTHLPQFLAYKYIIKSAAKRAIKVITVSESVKQDIAVTLDVPEEKISVTYEGALLARQDDSVIGAVKDKFLLKRPYLLFVGTLERKKNVNGLTKGFDAFLSKYKLNMDLVVAGKVDAHYPEIKLQALNIKYKNNLVFTDYISNKDLAALYQGAYAFISASIHEGFGLPGVEAMNFGLPLLVSNIPVFNEIYDNAAIYFDSQSPDDIAEKIFLICSDNQFYKKMQQQSADRARQFSWEQTANLTLQIYKNSLKII